MSYRPDARSRDDLLQELMKVAAGVEVPSLDRRPDATAATWGDVLAADELSSSLLERIVDRVGNLSDHLGELPAAAKAHWFEHGANIERLPGRPAEVVVAAEVDEALAPVVVPAGTTLKGPKGDNGEATVFETTDGLNATGAVVSDLVSYHASESTGNELVIYSEVLAFSEGILVADITFTGPDDVAALADLDWFHSGPEGDLPAAVSRASSRKLRLRLSGSCVPQPVLDDPDAAPVCYLKASSETVSASAAEFAFTSVKVGVSSRSNVIPSAAFYNDGVVDITREFKPFGEVPRRGDSFYLQCDEALSKPLSQLDITFTPLSAVEYAVYRQVSLYQGTAYNALLASIPLEAEIAEAAAPDSSYARVATEAIAFDLLAGASPPPPEIKWQVRQENTWTDVGEPVDELADTLLPFSIAASASDETTLGGVDGRFVRAFLSAGDFGWDGYLKNLASFATNVANDADAEMPTQPVPPTLDQVRLSYQTRSVTAARVVSVVGPSRRNLSGGGRPFVHPLVQQRGGRPAAAIYVGLNLPAASNGTAISLFVDVDERAACISQGNPEVAWEYWNGTTWTVLATADGTTGLRTSGLVKFVAPVNWPIGCPETSASAQNWVRLSTNRPEEIGEVRTAIADAVLATAIDGAGGPIALAAPEPEAVKGPRTRIEGVKKLVNPLAGTASQSPELAEPYVERAAQVTRTRNRFVQPPDYEMAVSAAFSEVAFVACLSHFAADSMTGSRMTESSIAPGSVAVLIVPNSNDVAPLPSADLVLRVSSFLQADAPVSASVSVLCPAYRYLSVTATIVLSRGAAALDARDEISDAIDAFLHPLGRSSAALGQPVYRSSIVALIEGLAVVDRVDSLMITSSDTRDGESASLIASSRLDRRLVKIDPPSPSQLGLVVSSGTHHLQLVEQLS